MAEEFSARVECPHCGEVSHEVIPFNFMEAEQSGCNSGPVKIDCSECCKSYWVKARVSFEVDVWEVSKRRIK